MRFHLGQVMRQFVAEAVSAIGARVEALDLGAKPARRANIGVGGAGGKPDLPGQVGAPDLHEGCIGRGGRVEEHSLVPLGEVRLGRIGLDEWLRRSQARA